MQLHLHKKMDCHVIFRYNMDIYIDNVGACMPFSEKIKPTTSLLLFSMPCEKKAAYIANKANTAIDEKDYAQVLLRFLQTRVGEQTTTAEIRLAAVLSVGLLIKMGYEFSSTGFNTHFWLMAVDVLFFLANIPPNISNSQSYNVIKTRCGNWLQSEFPHDFKTIDAMHYRDSGQIKLFLKQKKIDTLVNKSTKSDTIIQNALTTMMSLALANALGLSGISIIAFAMEICREIADKIFSVIENSESTVLPRKIV